MRSRVALLEGQQRALESRGADLQKRLASEQQRVGALSAQLEQGKGRSAPELPQMASLALLAGISRSAGDSPTLVLKNGAQVARIELQLEPRDDFPRFRAELRTRSGEELLIRSNLVRHRSGAAYSVAFELPASALPSGEYELALKGIANDSPQDLGFYYFRVKQ
jgi:hypothetical protein